jgi:phosphatidylinositol-3-phosphatase
LKELRHRPVLTFTLVCLAALAVVTATLAGGSGRAVPSRSTPARSALGPCGVARRPPATYSHVVWILFENKGYNQVIGSQSAPYINSLARECGLATDYYALAHPSLPNYLAMTSGSTQGVTNDNNPSSHSLRAASIFSQLGHNWRSLEQSMPTNCSLSDHGNYAVRHNPAAYYIQIRSACRSLDNPLASTPDISARLTFVTPNVCSDMHSCPISAGDAWLSTFLPKILNSSTYAAGRTAVFITWDEADYPGDYSNTSSHVPALVISPTTPAGGRSSTRFTHYSLLRTTEELLGLACLTNACRATSMRSAFRF